MQSILLTGAAGIVGSLLRPLMAERYEQVVITDLAEIVDPAPNETFIQGDIVDLAFVKDLAGRVDGIVHLAGMVGAQYTFDEVLGPNIVGTHNIYLAARDCGVSHVVFASSHHAVGFLRRGTPIDETTAPVPDSQYGLSKAFGEDCGAYYAKKFGLNVLAIRIGFVGEKVSEERRLHTWVSPRDLAQLIHLGLSTENLGYEVVYGVSDNHEPFFDNRNAFRLGYRPQDRSVDFVSEPSVLNLKPDLTSIVGAVVGGGFASVGYQGDPKRVTGEG